jgi:hypothetical protein
MGDAFLTVCNKGNVAIFVAKATSALFGFNVSGWKTVKPGDCQLVYSENAGPATYLGFAFSDTQGHLVAGHVERVPDFGWDGFTRVLTTTSKRFCASEGGMSYRLGYNSDPNCAKFQATPDDRTQYVSFPTTLHFSPKTEECSAALQDGPYTCSGGAYYLNVSVNRATGEVQASEGTAEGQDQPSTGPSLGDQMLSELAKAAAERRRRQQEEQAEDQVQATAQAAARVQANICLPDELTREWRNPPAKGKMENLKQQLIVTLRERANTPSYDQTLWLWVDSQYYPAWVPGTSLYSSGKMVFMKPGSSCTAPGVHREILPLN